MNIRFYVELAKSLKSLLQFSRSSNPAGLDGVIDKTSVLKVEGSERKFVQESGVGFGGIS